MSKKPKKKAPAAGEADAAGTEVTNTVARADVGDYIQSRIDNDGATDLRAVERADGDFDVTSDR